MLYSFNNIVRELIDLTLMLVLFYVGLIFFIIIQLDYYEFFMKRISNTNLILKMSFWQESGDKFLTRKVMISFSRENSD